MDNFRLDATSQGLDNLERCMKVIVLGHRKAIGYEVNKEKGLILFWAEHERATPLPFGLDAKGAAEFMMHWLEEADYGSEPDHDGDNGKGWRVYSEGWGHVDDLWQAHVAIQPVWAMYGK